MKLFDRNDKSLTCYYCGLHHDNVEAGGIYYCPNPMCRGPGGAGFRSRLKSYREVDSGRHTVDNQEWITVGMKAAVEAGGDILLAAIRSAQVDLKMKEVS